MYGMWFEPGFGMHVDKTSGVATGNDPESIYAVMYGTFWLNFHRFDRFELDLRGRIHVRGAAFSWLRLKWADMVLI